MTDITREKESSFCMDILKYINLAIEDNDTDGDRLVASVLACLSSSHCINMKRVAQFYRDAREKIS